MAVAFSLRRRIFAEHINVRTFIITAAALFAFTGAASAQTVPTTSDVERPFGMGWDNFDTPINPSTRDENGNRTIVNGRMAIEGTLSGGLMDDYASGYAATAIGNQLNVVTQGNYNTVIVDSTQINNGDISAEAGD
jgi:holdfast attachment protein HfaA